MIVKNGDIALLVEDAAQTVNGVTRIATENGGYVLNSQINSGEEYRYASMTLAVPAENLEISMRRIGDLALEVTRKSTAGEDVSIRIRRSAITAAQPDCHA